MSFQNNSRGQKIFGKFVVFQFFVPEYQKIRFKKDANIGINNEAPPSRTVGIP